MSHWRRFFKEEERDPWLSRTLADEAPGILNWIVAGAVQWYANGLGDPPVVKEASKAYRHTSDELAGFIGTVVVDDPEGSIFGADLMGLYLDWCVAENTRSWSRRALYGAVIERIAGAYKEKRMDGIHIVGVRLA
jgi:putative DNA primase/helicase